MKVFLHLILIVLLVEVPSPGWVLSQDDFLKKEIIRLIEARDLEGLVRIMNDLQNERKFGYDYLLADLCSSFNSYDFNNVKQYLYARNCSKDLLKNSDELSINLELKLIENLQGIEEYRAGLVSQKKWREDRAERIGFLLHLWNRLQKNIDRNFDIKDLKNRPIGNVSVPGPYLPGTRPEDVKEPEIRAKYIEAIKANKAKAEKFSLQVQLHRLDETLPAFAEQFIIGMYKVKPLDLNELNKNLRLFDLDEERKQRILDAVNVNLKNN